jgi:hypothetical protein
MSRRLFISHRTFAKSADNPKDNVSDEPTRTDAQIHPHKDTDEDAGTEHRHEETEPERYTTMGGHPTEQPRTDECEPWKDECKEEEPECDFHVR